MGCTKTPARPDSRKLTIVSSTVGPSHSPPDIPWLWKAKRHEPISKACPKFHRRPNRKRCLAEDQWERLRKCRRDIEPAAPSLRMHLEKEPQSQRVMEQKHEEISAT